MNAPPKQDWRQDYDAIVKALEERGWQDVYACRARRPRPAVSVWASAPDRKGALRQRYLECVGNPSPADIVEAFAFRFKFGGDDAEKG